MAHIKFNIYQFFVVATWPGNIAILNRQMSFTFSHIILHHTQFHTGTELGRSAIWHDTVLKANSYTLHPITGMKSMFRHVSLVVHIQHGCIVEVAGDNLCLCTHQCYAPLPNLGNSWVITGDLPMKGCPYGWVFDYVYTLSLLKSASYTCQISLFRVGSSLAHSHREVSLGTMDRLPLHSAGIRADPIRFQLFVLIMYLTHD